MRIFTLLKTVIVLDFFLMSISLRGD
jgi:hypothetical protein